MQPGAILSILLALAVGAGFVLHRAYIRATTKPTAVTSSTAPSPPPPSAKWDEPLAKAAKEIAELRGLAFREPPKFQQVSRDRVAEFWKESVREIYGSDAFERLGLAYQFLGFLEPDVEVEKLMLSAAAPFRDWAYNPNNETILHAGPGADDLVDPMKREHFAHQVMLNLLDEVHGLDKVRTLPEAQSDESLARLAFITGDAAYHAAKHGRGPGAATTPMPETLEYFARVPQPLQDQLLLGFREGMAFCHVVASAGVALDSLYQRPPTCTAHLLHPESFLAQPRYQPRRIKWPKLDLLGAEPRWDNVAGELLIRGLLRKVMSNAEADPIAAAWDGDRHLLYVVGAGPQIAWKTLWKTPAGAEAFFRAITNATTPIFGVEKSSLLNSSATEVEYSGNLSLLIKLEGDSVRLLRVTTPEWRATLDGLIREASVFRG